MFRSCMVLLLACLPLPAQLVRDVRAAIAQGDFAAGERQVEAARQADGVTPEMLEALSWLGRGALQAGKLEEAERYAARTREQALGLLDTRGLDAESRLPIALGASIEVQAHVMAERGARSEAVAFLNGEVERWRDTSIRTRIQKNIHLLSLEGKPAPPLEMDRYLGAKPEPLATLQGNPLLLYFWAHWCPDCRFQAPILARFQQEYAAQGLRIIGPTQLYGYATRGQDATPAEEMAWIDKVRREHYAEIPNMPVPVSEASFINYGSSTTPTLVLVDRQGIVRLYHPGRMTYEELAPEVAEVVRR